MTKANENDRPDQRPDESLESEEDLDDRELLTQVHRRASRMQRWLRDGEPSLMRQFAAVGVLGWIIVIPALLGIALGRMLDRWFTSNLMFTGAFLVIGIALGCWSAWRWMHEQ